MKTKIWTCKVGEIDDLFTLSDRPLREAVELAYFEHTGRRPEFVFSGWHGELTEDERSLVDRAPSLEKRVNDFNQRNSNSSPYKLINDLWAEIKTLRSKT